MKIFHVTSSARPTFKTQGVYAGFERFFGHIVTFKNNRNRADFAHIINPDGTRVNHIDYPTFKELADNFEHVYIRRLESKKFTDLLVDIEHASRSQLIAISAAASAELSKIDTGDNSK